MTKNKYITHTQTGLIYKLKPNDQVDFMHPETGIWDDAKTDHVNLLRVPAWVKGINASTVKFFEQDGGYNKDYFMGIYTL